jgi:hypothetical protein
MITKRRPPRAPVHVAFCERGLAEQKLHGLQIAGPPTAWRSTSWMVAFGVTR